MALRERETCVLSGGARSRGPVKKGKGYLHERSRWEKRLSARRQATAAGVAVKKGPPTTGQEKSARLGKTNSFRLGPPRKRAIMRFPVHRKRKVHATSFKTLEAHVTRKEAHIIRYLNRKLIAPRENLQEREGEASSPIRVKE